MFSAFEVHMLLTSPSGLLFSGIFPIVNQLKIPNFIYIKVFIPFFNIKDRFSDFSRNIFLDQGVFFRPAAYLKQTNVFGFENESFVLVHDSGAATMHDWY